MIDTHSHIYLPEFKEDINQVLKNALDQGVEKILMPAIDASSHDDLFSLATQHNNMLYAMIGLHPCSVKENYQQELAICQKYLEDKTCIAIGEIGLDYYWDTSFAKEQKDAFSYQIAMALNADLPIAIHSRNSMDDSIAIVKSLQNGNLRGVFHCFGGSIEQAKQIIDLGFYLGIGGVLTYKKTELDKIITHIPLQHIVLETDAPYLSPVPMRGKRNEPSYLIFVANKLAEIYKCSTEEIDNATTENAKKLFKI